MRFKTLFSILFIFLLACSPSEEVSSQDSEVNMATPEGAFLQILSYADNNDFNSFKNSISNPLYLQKRVEELNILDLNAAAQFKESVLRKYQGLEVTITSEITNNEAILTVSAIKNDQQKKDKFIVKKVIGTKKRLGLGITWTNRLANELHKSIKKNLKKRVQK